MSPDLSGSIIFSKPDRMIANFTFKTLSQWLFAFFVILLTFPTTFYNLPADGLDSSWLIAIHLAHKYHLVFGKDFVFTYGPLGILCSRLPISINKYVYLLFDLYYFGTLFFILKEVFRKQFSYGLVIFAFLSLTTAMYQYTDLLYFLFFFYFLFSFISKPEKVIYIAQAALLSLVGFFTKEGAGSIEVILFFAAISYLLFRRKLYIRIYVAIIMLYLFCLLAGARVLHVDLTGYIVSSVHLIDAYNDSMLQPLSGDLFMSIGYAALVIILIIATLIGYTLVISVRKRKIAADPDGVFIYCLIALGTFILFKTGFVRADGHTFYFFKNIALLASMLYLFRPQHVAKKLTTACCVLVLIVSIWGVNTLSGSYEPYHRILNLSILSERAGEIKNYFTQFHNYDKEKANAETMGSGNNELKDIIGSHSVDIIPAEISKIYFNGLVYNPRPDIQSYSTYDEYLDDLNYQKYMSDNAPDYILFSLSSIDDRYPFFDESKTKLAILSRYMVVSKIKTDILLKKRPTPIDLPKPGNGETFRAKFGEDIPVKKTRGLQFAKISVHYSLWGKIRRFFFQPPLLKISITSESGDAQSFRAIKPILAGGVILNKYIDNTEAFLLFMQGGGNLNADIKRIRLESGSGKAVGFSDNIGIESV